jgi:hypothetical protein
LEEATVEVRAREKALLWLSGDTGGVSSWILWGFEARGLGSRGTLRVDPVRVGSRDRLRREKEGREGRTCL